MNETIIGFEVAKLAKEKGFDIGCNDKFYDLPEHQQMRYGSGKYWEVEEGYENYSEVLGADSRGIYNRPFSNVYERPTQSSLQKWLRETRKINVWVQPFVICQDQSEYSCIADDTFTYFVYRRNEWIIDETNFLIFEEAFEKALLEGLKSIPDESQK